MLEILIFSIIMIVFGIIPAIWYLKQKNKPNDGQLYILDIIDILFVVTINTFLIYLVISIKSILYTLIIVYILPILILLVYRQFNPSIKFKVMIKVIRFASYLILLISMIYLFTK